MLHRLYLPLFLAALGKPVFSQDINATSIPGSNEEVVPFCAIFPEICEPGLPTSGDLAQAEAVWSIGNDTIKVPVPICKIDPRLCAGDLASNDSPGVGLITDNNAGNFTGMIVVDPADLFVREGLLVIPLSRESFEGIE